MREIAPFIPLVILVFFCLLGYRFLKRKGYADWKGLFALSAIIPSFWIIAGFLPSKLPDKKSKIWSGLAVAFGLIYFVYFMKYGISISNLGTPILANFIVITAFLGYRFMKWKGYTSWNYVAIIISFTPLFWIVFGLLKSNNQRTKAKRIWSFVAITGGLILLYVGFLVGKSA